MPKCLSKLNNQLINTTYNSCSAIITPSSKLKNNIINLFPNSKNKISIIPNPVDEEIFIQKKDKINDVFSIICVALFRQEKRLDLLIKTFKKLIDTGINAKLTLVGDGPLKYKLLNLINKLSLSPYINVKGYLSQDLLVKELHKNDVLVSASEVETFGITLIEAQSCGLPIIATNCGGPSDIISSKTGILIQPNSINELLKALITINQSLKNYNSQIIRKITINKFGKLKYYNSIKNAISI